MTQFCLPGESVDLSGFVSNSSARMVPNNAFASQSHNSRSDFWIGDSGASCHMTNGASKMYCMRTPHFDQKEVITSDGTRLKVEYIGNIDVIFHGRSDEPIIMIDVSYVPDFKFNLFSFHKAQQTHVIILDAAGAHIVGKNLTFPCERGGSYLRATRLVAGTVGAKPRTNRPLVSQISTPLLSCVSSFPPSVLSSLQVSSASNVSGTDGARDDSLEPIPFPPLSSVLRNIQFVGKTLSRPACRIGTPLDINHLHVSLAHAHASVLKATAKQHEIRLTGELVSCVKKGKRGACQQKGATVLPNRTAAA